MHLHSICQIGVNAGASAHGSMTSSLSSAHLSLPGASTAADIPNIFRSAPVSNISTAQHAPTSLHGVTIEACVPNRLGPPQLVYISSSAVDVEAVLGVPPGNL